MRWSHFLSTNDPNALLQKSSSSCYPSIPTKRASPWTIILTFLFRFLRIGFLQSKTRLYGTIIRRAYTNITANPSLLYHYWNIICPVWISYLSQLPFAIDGENSRRSVDPLNQTGAGTERSHSVVARDKLPVQFPAGTVFLFLSCF